MYGEDGEQYLDTSNNGAHGKTKARHSVDSEGETGVKGEREKGEIEFLIHVLSRLNQCQLYYIKRPLGHCSDH